MSAWTAFLPELAAFGAAMAFLALSLADRPNPRRLFAVAVGASLCVILAGLAAARMEGSLFAQAYRVDLYSQVVKVLLAMGLFLIVCLCTDLGGIPEGRHAEFYMLLFVCTLAMMLLASAVHLISIYVALELSSYSLYVLVALRRPRPAAVSTALGFFLIGVVSSAIMLFGLAQLYGATGAAYLDDLARLLPEAVDQPLVQVGLLFTLCGFFFKLAVFPFHVWAADTYQGAAHQVTAFIATASKIAAIAILVRVAAASGGSLYLFECLVMLSVLSMTVGNLAALAQKDLKRLFAYSSIAQAGYVLVGILCLSPDGYAATLFYSVALLAMKYTCFLVLVLVATGGVDIEISQLAGLHRRSPILAMALMMSVFSLAGIPPTIGFTGKFLIFNAAIREGQLVLVLIAMANVVISLYYYLMVVRAAYLLEPAAELPPLRLAPGMRLLAGALVAFMVGAGIYPVWFLEISQEAVAVLSP